MAPGLLSATAIGLIATCAEPLAALATLQVWAFYFYRIALFQVLARRALGRQMAMHLAIEGSRSLWLLLALHAAVPLLGIPPAAAVLAAYPASHLVLLAFFGLDRAHFPLHLPRRMLPRAPLRKLVRDRWRLAVAVLKNIVDALPLWLLGIGSTMHDVGLFSLIQRLAAFPYGFLRRAETLLMVHFCANSRSDEFRRAAVVQVAAAAALAMASAAAALAAASLFPMQYQPALGMFAVYVCVLLPAAMTGAVRSRLMAAADYRTLAIHYSASCVLATVIIGGTLLLGGQLRAVVIATIASYAVSSGIIAALAHRSGRPGIPATAVENA
jgi:hypothetical protein